MREPLIEAKYTIQVDDFHTMKMLMAVERAMNGGGPYYAEELVDVMGFAVRQLEFTLGKFPKALDNQRDQQGLSDLREQLLALCERLPTIPNEEEDEKELT